MFFQEAMGLIIKIPKTTMGTQTRLMQIINVAMGTPIIREALIHIIVMILKDRIIALALIVHSQKLIP